MQLKVTGSRKNLTVADRPFTSEFNRALVHQAVVSYLAAARSGTKANKSRSDVRGGGTKPWRQKGMGRARAGTIRSPLWRGGGVTFAAKAREHKHKLNKKMYRAAMCAIFSELVRQERLVVVDDFKVKSHKTRELMTKLDALTLDSVLIITHQADKNLYLAARNLYTVDVSEVGGLDPVSLIRYDKVLATVDAIKRIEDWLS